MKLDWILRNGPLIFALVELIVYNIVLICKIRSSKSSDEKLKLTQTVLSSIASFCVEAEQMFGSSQGEHKKQWAMQQAKLKSVELGVKIPDDILSDAIEDVVTATNQININKGV